MKKQITLLLVLTMTLALVAFGASEPNTIEVPAAAEAVRTKRRKHRGCGQYESVQAASNALVEVSSTIQPDPGLTAKYEARYQQFPKIYPACKELFAALA